MKQTLRNSILGLILIFSTFYLSAQNDNQLPPTVVDIVVNSDDHTTLEAAVVAAGLVETLQGDGPFTVFAPTDAAFAALPDGTLDALLADIPALTDILTYHVVASKAMSTDLSVMQKIVTVQGKKVTVTINDDGVFIDNAKVTVADIEADNGVVHVIDAVLIPSTLSATVVDIVVNSDDHTTLEDAVVAAGLVETLQGDGPFTVFAPTDAAFAALPDGTLDALLADIPALTDILTYHVVASKAMSTDLSDMQKIVTVQGKKITVTINDDGVFIDNAKVTVADIEADNGVVHVIDAVLIPSTLPATVVDIIVDSDDHTTLEVAVVAAGLVETLQGDGPFTVFAPTDAAFATLPDGTLDALLADIPALTDILTYHVVGSKAMSTDLSDMQRIVTVQGKKITVTINDDGVFIDNAKVTVADIEADNGVVHVIDAVLIPSTLPATVVDIVVNSDDHTTLEAAVVAAGLVETLQGDGPFTVFAPTDAAFAALPDGTLDALLADIPALTDILTYHVVGSKAMSTDLSDMQKIVTVQGKKVTVTINDDGVFIDNAKVTVADIEADNGVVHVIDAVLIPSTLPATVVDIVVNSEDHTTLEAAVVAAGLVETLQGDGPFTVFAPTDAAFAALPDGTLDALLADIPALTDILTYHVVGAKAMSTDLSDMQKIVTVNGKKITVTINDDGVFIDNAKVTVADIEADNGVVHVIDAVLIPSTLPATVVDIVVNSDDHTTLEAAVVAAGLVETLQGDGPFTVFAPTDAAFAALPDGTLDALLADIPALTDILTYHVVASKAMSTDLSDGQMIETVLGKDIKVMITEDGVYINNAKVTVADIEADNGVVHVIDAVLLPSADVRLMETENMGKIMTDAFGNSLYFFSKDANGMSLCTDGCLNNWPAFYAKVNDFGDGLDADDFGAIDRGDGMMQTTYKGWPLYYFINDTVPGLILGDGVIGKWFVAKPDYTIMISDNQLTGLDGNNYKGDYTVGDEVIQYFTDDKGLTLYTWKNDKFNTNKFTNSDFSNDAVWPIYEQTDIVIPSVLNKADFGVISVFGKNQLTFKGWPLYYFGQDMMIRGNTKGVSVPEPGIWPVAVNDMMAPDYATVVDIIVNSEDHTTLEAAVVAAGLVETLQGDGPFTVFAPTDAAFAALPDGTLDALLADIPALTDILTYHVVGSKEMSTDLSDMQKIVTVQGKKITVTINDDGVFIDNAKVTVADIEADNGVVHVIDAVLIPSTLPSTVVDIIVNSEDHTTLEAAVVAAGLVETLQGDGPFTVFAPTDAAFAALPDGTLDALLADIPALTDILTYHVVGAKAMSTDLSDMQKILTVQGKKVTVTINDDGVFIDNAKVTVADIEADNGVVHVIDAVLIPSTLPATVVDIIVDSDDHTTLEAAVVAAGLVETLQGDGPFTVFAPTDAAFAALPDGTLDALLADIPALTDILTYHVVGAKAMSTDLSDGQMITTVNGKKIKVTINDDGVFIDNAKVTVADIEADNGVVHVIDAVLIPPVITVVDIIVDSEDHTTLEAAVVAAGLVETLQGDGPFTVFAPTDAAFAALPDGTLDALLADIPALTDILTYHVVASKAMSTDLSDMQKIVTVQGKKVTVTINDDGVFIDNAKVTVADIEADNGVVHVIDAVLIPSTLPATVVDIVVNSDDHTTLEAAVVAAGLVETLQGDGPFTVFAPTDAAFAALPDGTLDALLADIPALTDILTYHVVASKAMSTDLSDMQKIVTVNGKKITVTINDDGVFIDNAKVTVADIEADNGVVHVIDAVLIPSTLPATVVDIVVNSDDHTTLEAAVVAAGLVETLQGDGPFTVFAPTDAAFAALPDGTLDALLADIPALTDILTYHVVGTKAMSTDLSDGQIITTLFGEDVTVTITEDGVYINDAMVTVVDIEADNGVVHVIDKVLLPNQNPTSVTDFNELDVKIYPNPASNVLNIQTTEPLSKIRILNLAGVTVLNTNSGSNSERLDISDYVPGIYFVVVETRDNRTTRKIIIR